jgi:hypothetical protein
LRQRLRARASNARRRVEVRQGAFVIVEVFMDQLRAVATFAIGLVLALLGPWLIYRSVTFDDWILNRLVKNAVFYQPASGTWMCRH